MNINDIFGDFKAHTLAFKNERCAIDKREKKLLMRTRREVTFGRVRIDEL